MMPLIDQFWFAALERTGADDVVPQRLSGSPVHSSACDHENDLLPVVPVRGCDRSLSARFFRWFFSRPSRRVW